MVKITPKEKDNIKSRNVAVIVSKYPVICITGNSSKNVLTLTTMSIEENYNAALIQNGDTDRCEYMD